MQTTGLWWVQVRAVRSGNATAIADILRLVEEAQARTAPVQRLADAVAGKFAYAVMVVSAATFAFWATLGTRVFPQVRHPYDTVYKPSAGFEVRCLSIKHGNISLCSCAAVHICNAGPRIDIGEQLVLCMKANAKYSVGQQNTNFGTPWNGSVKHETHCLVRPCYW